MKSLRERLESWDIKSLFLAIGVIGILFAIKLLLGDSVTDILREYEQGHFTGTAKGEVIAVEPIEEMSQTRRRGTTITLTSYRVSYRFEINGKTFQHVDIIPVTAAYRKFLTSILERKEDAVFNVKFDVNDPLKSVLVQDINKELP
jgi:hypothetical protein